MADNSTPKYISPILTKKLEKKPSVAPPPSVTLSSTAHPLPASPAMARIIERRTKPATIAPPPTALTKIKVLNSKPVFNKAKTDELIRLVQDKDTSDR